METRHVLELPIPNSWALPIQRWVNRMKAAGLSERTVETRLRHIKRIARAFAEGPPEDITSEVLLNWCAAQEWKPETRRGYYSSLRSFYATFDVDPEWKNPTSVLPRVRCGQGVPRPAPDSALKVGIIAAGSDPRLLLILSLAAAAGLRCIEVSRVHVNDIWQGPRGHMLTVVGKGDKTRHIPIPDWLAHNLILAGHSSRNGWVFPGQINGHLSERYVGRLAAAVLPDHWTLHTLRHWAGVNAYQATKDLRAVQEFLGHTSISTTQLYTKPSDDSFRETVKGADLKRLFMDGDDPFPLSSTAGNRSPASPTGSTGPTGRTRLAIPASPVRTVTPLLPPVRLLQLEEMI